MRVPFTHNEFRNPTFFVKLGEHIIASAYFLLWFHKVYNYKIEYIKNSINIFRIHVSTASHVLQ